MKGSIDKGISKDDSKKAHAGSGTSETADSGESTSPSDEPLTCKSLEVLDEQSPTDSNVSAPPGMHLKKSAENDRDRGGDN